MSVQILDAMARGGFEEVVALNEPSSNLRGFLGIHDTSRGAAFGGIRRWRYRDESEALRDCLRLSRAMTQKCVLADLPAGGAKLVIEDRPDLDLERAYDHIGVVVERLGGRFFTGPDVGTGDRELSWVAGRTSYVTRPDETGPGELAEATGEGVFRSMETALAHVDGEVDWPRRRIVVQGLGKVGTWLARRLVSTGATVLAAEVDSEIAHAVQRELDIELIEASRVYDVECDVLSPNALGGILHDLSIARLGCRMICGAANNVLARPEHGQRLSERGILFAPDFITGSGALIRGVLFHLENRREPVEAIGRRVGATLGRVLELADERGESPANVAVEEADALIRAGREDAERWRRVEDPGV